jgi:hypothetical protein
VSHQPLVAKALPLADVISVTSNQAFLVARTWKGFLGGPGTCCAVGARPSDGADAMLDLVI